MIAALKLVFVLLFQRSVYDLQGSIAEKSPNRLLSILSNGDDTTWKFDTIHQAQLNRLRRVGFVEFGLRGRCIAGSQACQVGAMTDERTLLSQLQFVGNIHTFDDSSHQWHECSVERWIQSNVYELKFVLRV